MNEKLVRFVIFIFTVLLHIAVIFFIVFETQKNSADAEQPARVMKLTDLAEFVPPPSTELEIPLIDEIAEIITGTDISPVQEAVAVETLHIFHSQEIIIPSRTEEVFLPMHQVSVSPFFDERALIADLVYPPIALRSRIEGRVILELFVDRSGTVQRIAILREEPEGRGFGEAAVRAFTNRKGTPGFANGEPVSVRYRYPVRFSIR